MLQYILIRMLHFQIFNIFFYFFVGISATFDTGGSQREWRHHARRFRAGTIYFKLLVDEMYVPLAHCVLIIVQYIILYNYKYNLV